VKTVPLTQGQVAIVDDASWDLVSSYSWCALRNPRNGKYYAVAHEPGCNKKLVYMHRLVAGSPLPFVNVHHLSKQPLDNRRANLRCVTPSEHRRLEPRGSRTRCPQVTP